MKKRALGRSGIEVGPLAFGGNVFGWTVGEADSFRLLDAFVAAGLNLIDTADVYSRWIPGNQGGESETIIGKWLKRGGRRDQVVIATKLGMELGPGRKGLSKARMVEAVEDSLRRLQTDRIDLYQAHIDDAETPLEETLEAFAGLVSQGKVRAIGASNYSAPRLAQALDASARLGLPRYETLQPPYSLCERAEYETALEPLCRERGVGVICYFPLASGFLTGKYRSAKDAEGRARGQRVAGYMNERGWRILAALDGVAARTRCTPAQAALAWVMARPGVTAPIASATSTAQLEELVGAARLVLPPEEIAALTAASTPA
ncbi:MAG: aldo/keto reductase [Elusimicrobia bacterium]|nr:aldo/keto reductase [Elusimicrobiota bacterium]